MGARKIKFVLLNLIMLQILGKIVIGIENGFWRIENGYRK